MCAPRSAAASSRPSVRGSTRPSGRCVPSTLRCRAGVCAAACIPVPCTRARRTRGPRGSWALGTPYEGRCAVRSVRCRVWWWPSSLLPDRYDLGMRGCGLGWLEFSGILWEGGEALAEKKNEKKGVMSWGDIVGVVKGVEWDEALTIISANCGHRWLRTF